MIIAPFFPRRGRGVVLVLQFLWCDQSPGLVQMKSQLFIADSIQLDTNPAGYANVRRPVKLLWRAFDQHLLDSYSGRYRDRNMPIVVMVNGAHGKHLLNEESWFSMREFLRSARQGETNPSNSLDMLFALIGLLLFRGWFQRLISNLRLKQCPTNSSVCRL